jgi:hypothetical protein
MSFSKYNKVRGKFESLETRQLFAADLAGGAVVDAPATADSAPVATASDRCEAPSVRLQLGGIANQMSLMQRFSYNGTTMRKNDTSVAGDQYQTDTCHVDEYGTISMTFKSDLAARDGIQQVSNQVPNADDQVGFNPQPQPPGNDWVIVGNPSLQEQPGSDGFWVAPSPEAAAVVELSNQIDADSGDNINQLGDIKGEATDKDHITAQNIKGSAVVRTQLEHGPGLHDSVHCLVGSNPTPHPMPVPGRFQEGLGNQLEHGPGLHDSVHCLVGSNPTPHPMPVPGRFQEGLGNQLEHGPGLHDSVHCLVGGAMRTAQRSKGPDFAAHPRLVDQAMAENGSPSQADGDVLPGKTAFLPWRRG